MNYGGKPFPLVIFIHRSTLSFVNEAGSSIDKPFVTIQENHSQRNKKWLLFL
jgi:hypothetical protein